MSAAAVHAGRQRRGRGRRIAHTLAWLGLIAVVAMLLGIDIGDWLSRLWDALTEVSIGLLVAGLLLDTAQTVLTALAWLAILRSAYPDAGVTFGPVLTSYTVAVAMNGVLPANAGTFVMLFMFVALVAGATVAGIVSGYVVHKLFFMVAGGAVYLYLFLSVSGSFSIQLGAIAAHPILTLVIVGGAVALVALLVRLFWGKLKTAWQNARKGAAILGRPREYALRVFLPELGGYAAKLGVIAVFLGAYGIPVTFHTVMSVVGSNSIANVTSVTPGGVGVNQALNAASLRNVTDTETATAYSIAQQLLTTAWDIVFAIVLIVLVFGWSGGRELVGRSYASARTKMGRERSHA